MSASRLLAQSILLPALAVAALVSSAGLASAQVTLPPGKPAAKTPEWTPPPPPDPNAIKPAPVAPPKPVIAANDPACLRELAQVNPPLTPWERDGSGRLLKLDEPIHWAALKRNSALQIRQRLELQPFLEFRRRQVETAILEAIPALRMLANGYLADFDMLNKTQREEWTKASAPLRSPNVPDFSIDFLRNGRFNCLQTHAHNKAVDAYRRGIIEELRTDAGLKPEDTGTEAGRKHATLVGRGMMMVSMDEPMWYYRWLVIESIDSATDFAKDLGLSPELQAQFAALITQAQSADEDAAKFDSARKALTLLTPEQEKTLLQKVIALRPPQPELPATPIIIETGQPRHLIEAGKAAGEGQPAAGGSQPSASPAANQPADQPAEKAADKPKS